jgi:hypothetical protein
VARPSSTKKAAKLAQKGKGRKVRFQGGTIFPAAVAITLVLGFALIVYSRQTLPEADSTPPTINDHWHAAYGFYLCDTWYKLAGNLEETNSAGQPAHPEFVRTGVHSHDDGVMHWHPFTAASTGKNAVLGVFLDTYDVELTDDTLKFPADNVLGPDDEYKEGETTCNGEDAELSVKVWDSYTDTDNGSRYIANMDRVHIDHDGMVFAIYFTPKDADQVMPPWSSELPSLGAVDTGQVAPVTAAPGASTPSSVPGATTSGSTPATSGPATTAPAASAPAATAPAATATENTAPPTTSG